MSILRRRGVELLNDFVRRLTTQVHLKRTEKSSRQQDIHNTKIVNLRAVSPTVKLVSLEVSGLTSFSAGQWLDFFVDQVGPVGGYSICSSPDELRQHRRIDLSVKYSPRQPAYWIHTEARVGDQVKIRVGGDVFYAPERGGDNVRLPPHSLLLIAGGVGINPIFSILRHAISLVQRGEPAHPKAIHLLYSAKSKEELLFREEIESAATMMRMFTVELFVTQQKPGLNESGRIQFSRLARKEIETAWHRLQQCASPSTFICGPPSLIDSSVDILTGLAVSKKDIYYEKWW